MTLAHTKPDRLDDGSSDGPRTEPALYVLLEGERPLAGGLRVSLDGIKVVEIGRGEQRQWSVRNGEAELQMPDARTSRRHARLVREEADAAWLLEDLGSTNGTCVGTSRIASAVIEEPTIFMVGTTAFLLLPAEPVETHTKLIEHDVGNARLRGMATFTPAIASSLPRLERVAKSNLSILLLGESGTGKEVLARAVHDLSRRAGPFVAINCGALAPTLVESQLFGFVKGAFSGATRDEPGLVRASSGGTLFLDEIGELPPSAQATLLRVIQEREVLPVGGTRAVPVDLRVVAATLQPIAQSPSFRTDLYARVAAFVHRLPTLRERRGDLGILVADLLAQLAPERAMQIAPDLVIALAIHDWPMNVRELAHVLSVACVTCADDVLRLKDTGDALPRASTPPPSGEPGARPSRPSGGIAKSLSEEDVRVRDEIVAILTRSEGNVTEVSRVMAKTRTQIHRWMKRFGIDPETFRA